MKPNIILITADQMRGDCIGALGHPDVKTPYLDSMINSGVAFRRAYSATPTCIPARAAIFTGLSQRSHKRVGYEDGINWNYPVTLPKVMADYGYHTQGIGKMHVWPPRSLMGFHNIVLHDGFLPNRNTQTSANTWWDRVDDYTPWLRQQSGFPADINDLGIDCNSWVARPFSQPEHLHPTNWTITESIDFLRRRDLQKPFFMWTSFVAPHPPFLPPSVYFDMYVGKKLTSPHIGSWAVMIGQEHPDYNSFEGQLDETDLQRMLAGYYGLVTHLDHQIGRLLRALKDENVLNNTIIIFTSDHGEMLGDHHMFRKSQPFEGSVSIPMILYDPGHNLKLPYGSHCDSLVELRDIMPTLLGVAGIPVPETVEGKNLLDSFSANSWRQYLHGEHTSQQCCFSVQYIVTQEFKYIWFSDSGREMLFDLAKDPHEMTDISANENYSQMLIAMRSLLAQELAGREEGYSVGNQLITGRPPRTLLH